MNNNISIYLIIDKAKAEMETIIKMSSDNELTKQLRILNIMVFEQIIKKHYEVELFKEENTNGKSTK